MAIKKKLYNLDKLYVGIIDDVKHVSNLDFSQRERTVLYKKENQELGVFYQPQLRTPLITFDFGRCLRVSDGCTYEIGDSDSIRKGDRCIQHYHIYLARDYLEDREVITEEQAREIMQGAIKKGKNVYISEEQVELLENYLEKALKAEETEEQGIGV